jgi:hypothetical protein
LNLIEGNLKHECLIFAYGFGLLEDKRGKFHGKAFLLFVSNLLLDSVLPLTYDLVVLVEFVCSEDLKHLFLVVLEFKSNENGAVLKSRSFLLLSSRLSFALSFLGFASLLASSLCLLECKSDFSLGVHEVVEHRVHVVVNFANNGPSSLEELLSGLLGHV